MEPMLSKDFVELIAGKGIVGDRYGEGCGTYTCFKEPGRQLTLISGDSFDELATGLPDAPPIGNLRRNVVVRGMTATQLRGHIGSELLLGADCRVFLHRSCVPCKYNERLNKCPGLEEHFWDVSGVNCEVWLTVVYPAPCW